MIRIIKAGFIFSRLCFLVCALLCTNALARGYEKFPIERMVTNSTLNVIDNIASLHVMQSALINFDNDSMHSFCVNFSPKFIEGHKKYPSSVIDFNIVKVTDNGESTSYKLGKDERGRDTIYIFSPSGENFIKGYHLFEVWYEIRNKVVPGIKIQSFSYEITNTIAKEHIYSVQLGSNLRLLNSNLSPNNNTLNIDQDNQSKITIYSLNNKNKRRDALFTVSFGENLNEYSYTPFFSDGAANMLITLPKPAYTRTLKYDLMMLIILLIVSIVAYFLYIRFLEKNNLI